jgi:ribokinase
MGRVGICGSVNMDVFGYVERPPAPGETVFGKRLSYASGGKGANQAVSARRMGAEVCFFGACGRDAFGDVVAAALADEGLDVSGLRRIDEPTGVALIVVSDDGENQIIVLSGANAHVKAPRPNPSVDVWLSQAEVPAAAVAGTLRAARATGALALLNPSPAGRLPADLVASFDIAIVNETELDALGDNLPPTVILTLGARGARILPDGPELPALPAKVADTTGAGDALAGTLAAGLAAGEPLEEALQLGLAAASICVERYGCQPAMPQRAEVDQRLAAHGRMRSA